MWTMVTYIRQTLTYSVALASTIMVSNMSYACSCANPTPYTFLTSGDVPSNSKGVLFHASDAHISYVEMWSPILRELPAPITEDLFDIVDLASNKSIGATVHRLRSGDLYRFHEKLFQFSDATLAECKKNSKISACAALEGIDFNDQAWIDKSVDLHVLGDVTDSYERGAGLFRIEPKSPFIVGHSYRVTAKHPERKEFYNEKFEKIPPDQTAWSTTVTVLDRELPTLDVTSIKLTTRGPPRIELVSTPAGGSCSSNVLSQVQKLEYEFDRKLSPFKDLALLFTYAKMEKPGSFMNLGVLYPQRAGFTPWLFPTSLCSQFRYGKLPFDGQQEFLVRQCPVREAVAPLPVSMRAKFGFLEVEDELYNTDPVEFEMPSLKPEDCNPSRVLINRLKDDAHSAKPLLCSFSNRPFDGRMEYSLDLLRVLHPHLTSTDEELKDCAIGALWYGASRVDSLTKSERKYLAENTIPVLLDHLDSLSKEIRDKALNVLAHLATGGRSFPEIVSALEKKGPRIKMAVTEAFSGPVHSSPFWVVEYATLLRVTKQPQDPAICRHFYQQRENVPPDGDPGPASAAIKEFCPSKVPVVRSKLQLPVP